MEGFYIKEGGARGYQQKKRVISGKVTFPKGEGVLLGKVPYLPLGGDEEAHVTVSGAYQKISRSIGLKFHSWRS